MLRWRLGGPAGGHPPRRLAIGSQGHSLSCFCVALYYSSSCGCGAALLIDTLLPLQVIIIIAPGQLLLSSDRVAHLPPFRASVASHGCTADRQFPDRRSSLPVDVVHVGTAHCVVIRCLHAYSTDGPASALQCVTVRPFDD